VPLPVGTDHANHEGASRLRSGCNWLCLSQSSHSGVQLAGYGGRPTGYGGSAGVRRTAMGDRRRRDGSRGKACLAPTRRTRG